MAPAPSQRLNMPHQIVVVEIKQGKLVEDLLAPIQADCIRLDGLEEPIHGRMEIQQRSFQFGRAFEILFQVASPWDRGRDSR